MGSLVHLPQLAIQPEQAPNPIDQYSKLASIQALSAQRQQQQALMPGQLQAQQQQLQAGLLDNQQKQQQLKQVQAMNSAFQSALTPDPTTGQPKFDSGKVLSQIAASGNGSMIPQLTETFNKIDQGKATLLKTKQDAASAQQDYEGSLGAEVKAAGYGPGAAGIALAHMAEVDPQRAQALQQQFTQNPALVKQWADTAIAGSPKQQEAMKNAAQATDASVSAQVKQQDLNFGDKVPQLNAALQQRYQVLHPGQSLPAPFTLGANASKADFDRVDKILEATEKSQGTKAQQDTTNAMRQQTNAFSQGMREQTLALAQGKSDLQPVIGNDPKTGKPVLASQGDAQDMGLTGTMKAGEQEVTKAQAARHWIPLAEKQGNTPESTGILPLIDKLDKEGKLGVVASRWNDFMAGKVGAADPDIAALRTKMGLSTTLLMNAHVGNRGGSYMLEHFQDLADSGKMNASTLRTGVKSELDYVKDRAMLPESKSSTPPAATAASSSQPQHVPGGQASGVKEGQTGTGSNGQKYVVKGGVWVAQ